MKPKKEALNLLDEILDRAIVEDEQHKQRMLKEGKGSKSLGESWMVFHLKMLKELIKE